MPSTPQHQHVEREFRRLLRTGEMPPPDEVAHWQDTLAFYWHETKAVVLIDLEGADLGDCDLRSCSTWGRA